MARRFAPSAGSRRQKQWIGPADQAGVAVPSATSVIISSFTPIAASMASPTLIRTRGLVNIFPVGGSDLSFTGAYGICVVTTQALAAGSGSVPRPFDDADWGGWIVWQAYSGRLEFQSGVGEQLLQSLYTIDSKAMRRMKTNEAVVTVCESQAGAVTCDSVIRKLFLLS